MYDNSIGQKGMNAMHFLPFARLYHGIFSLLRGLQGSHTGLVPTKIKELP